MPELPELRIMQDYINQNVEGRKFNKLYHVEKGNNPVDSELIENFQIHCESFGKELKLKLFNSEKELTFSVFMGMSGNWKWVKSEDCNSTKFIRMRIDSTDGYSLLLYGLYMGPKYKLGGFKTKRGPDPTKDFEKFKQNILENINSKVFDKPICEALLDQKYFNGIGNYIRSTIIYYLDINPFLSTRDTINKNPEIIEMCRDIPLKAYSLNGGQLSDWSNPFDTDKEEFTEWVFYQKGISCKDSNNRTFWFNPKWIEFCPYEKISIKK
jgi:endonuclease VIII-like 1